MQSSSQRRERACDFCGESVAPLYPLLSSEAAVGEERKRMVCHTCRSLGHGRPLVTAAGKVGARRTPDGVDDGENGKQPQAATTVARTRTKQTKVS